MNKVPKIFYQAWEDSLPSIIHNKNSLHLPVDIDYKLFSLKDMYLYLENNWGNKYVNLFKSYDKIAHKTDLWRYCILYDTGGMYMDADCLLLHDIDFIFDYDLLFVTNNRGVKDIFNGFIMAPPKCHIYKLMIDYMLKIGNNFNDDYYFNCKFLYQLVSKYIKIDSQNNISCVINNYNYKTLLMVDKYESEIIIDSKNDWIEKNVYIPYYDKKPILLECNKYYPYEKNNIIKIGNSNNYIKTISLNKIYPNNTKIFFIHNYNGTFSYKFNDYKLIITRTDKKDGWEEDLIGYL